MGYDRKEMLVDVPERPVVENEQKLISVVDEGSAYIGLKDSMGWKKLMKEFIEPNISEDLWLTAPAKDLPEVRAGIKKLKEMLSFINKKIEDSIGANEKLRKRKEGG